MRIRRDYQTACPDCRARAGQPCQGKQGERLPGVHFQRTVAMRKATLAAYKALYAPLKTRLLLCALLLSLSVTAFAKKQYETYTAKVISQDFDTHDGGTAVMPLYGGLIGVPLTQRSNIVMVETAHRRMTWVEAGRRSIVLNVNGTVQFYQDGNYFVVLDSRGKKHKFSMVHSEMLPDTSAK